MPEPLELTCDECGEPFEIDTDGIARHVDADGAPDWDRDASHTPYCLPRA